MKNKIILTGPSQVSLLFVAVETDPFLTPLSSGLVVLGNDHVAQVPFNNFPLPPSWAAGPPHPAVLRS